MFLKKKNKEIDFEIIEKSNEEIMAELEKVINENFSKYKKIIQEIINSVENKRIFIEKIEFHICEEEKNQRENIQEFLEKPSKLATDLTNVIAETKILITQYNSLILKEDYVMKKLWYEKKYEEFKEKHNNLVMDCENELRRNGLIQKEDECVKTPIK